MPFGAWSHKAHLSILITFLHQKLSITLQRIQVSSILSQVIVIGLIISWLLPPQNTPPISTTDRLRIVNILHINMADLSQAVNYGHDKISQLLWTNLCHVTFLNFTPLYISLIYGVFFTKNFQDCSFEKFIWGSGHALSIEYTYLWNFISNQYIEQKCCQMFIQPLQMLVPFADKNVLNVFLWLLIGFIQFCYEMVKISYVNFCNNCYLCPLRKVSFV
jgi:hypothetical protein